MEHRYDAVSHTLQKRRVDSLAVAMSTRPAPPAAPRQQLAMQLPGDMPLPIMKLGLAWHSPPAAHPGHCRACLASSSHAGV